MFTSTDIQAHDALVAEWAESNAAITPLDKSFAELIAIANDDMGSVLRGILSLHIKAHVVMAGASLIIRAQNEALVASDASPKADIGVACGAPVLAMSV